MTDDWLADHNRAAERLERIIKDRMVRVMEEGGKLQREMGDALGWDEPKVSKTLGMSRSARLPTEADIRQWWRIAGGTDEDRDDTLNLLADLKASKKTFREQLRAEGREPTQDRYLELYAQTTRFRNLQTAVVPGILQIPEYMRQLFRDLDAASPGAIDNIEGSVRKRLDRVQHLHDMSKTFEFLIAESALRAGAADAPVMVAQLDRLLSVPMLPNVTRFGIIPQMRRIHMPIQGGFMIYDDEVAVEFPLKVQWYRGEEAKEYMDLFERHWADAVEGDEARDLIRKVLGEFAGQ